MSELIAEIGGYLWMQGVGHFRMVFRIRRRSDGQLFVRPDICSETAVTLGDHTFVLAKIGHCVSLEFSEAQKAFISVIDAERHGIAKVVDGKVVPLPEKKPAREATVECLLNPPPGGSRAELCRLYNVGFVVDGNDVFVDCLKLKRSAREPAGLLIFVRSDGAEYVIAESDAKRVGIIE